MSDEATIASIVQRLSVLESDIVAIKGALSTNLSVQLPNGSRATEAREDELPLESFEDEFPPQDDPFATFFESGQALLGGPVLDPLDRKRQKEKKEHPAAFAPFTRSLSNFSLREFDPVWYLNRYRDLKRAFGHDLHAATKHYLTHGVHELRSPNPGFDPIFYYNHHRDLRRFPRNGKFLLEHWYVHGIEEGRQGSPLISLKHYLHHHSDLKSHFKDNHLAAFTHWKAHGHKERRQTAPGVTLQLAWGDQKLSNGKFRTADEQRDCIPEAGIEELGAKEILHFAICKKIPVKHWQQACKRAINKIIKFIEGDKPKVCDEIREIRVSKDPIFEGDIFVPDDISRTA
jgi:hypothetical protein